MILILVFEFRWGGVIAFVRYLELGRLSLVLEC